MSSAAKIFAGFPLHDNLSTGTEDSASLLTTPDMVRSGRVLLTSVKSPYALVTKTYLNSNAVVIITN